MIPARDPKQVFLNQLEEHTYDIYLDVIWIPLDSFETIRTHLSSLGLAWFAWDSMKFNCNHSNSLDLIRNGGGGILEAKSSRHLDSRKHLQTARNLPEAPRGHPGGTQEAPRRLRRHPGGTQEAAKRNPGGTQEAPRSLEAPRRQPGQPSLIDFYKLLCNSCIYLWLLQKVFECAMILDAFYKHNCSPAAVNGATAQSRALYQHR